LKNLNKQKFFEKDVECFLNILEEGFTESHLRNILTRFLAKFVPPIYKKRRSWINKNLLLECLNIDASYKSMKKIKVSFDRPPFVEGMEPECSEIGESTIVWLKVTFFVVFLKLDKTHENNNTKNKFFQTPESFKLQEILLKLPEYNIFS
jgi:hypothetical protein